MQGQLFYVTNVLHMFFFIIFYILHFFFLFYLFCTATDPANGNEHVASVHFKCMNMNYTTIYLLYKYNNCP